MAQIIIEIIEEKGDFYDILLKKTLQTSVYLGADSEKKWCVNENTRYTKLKHKPFLCTPYRYISL